MKQVSPLLSPVRLGRPVRTGAALAVLVALGSGSSFATERGADDRAVADSVCPWGRLADGRGTLIRCLTSEEAARLREAAPAVAPPLDATVPAVVPAPAAPVATLPLPSLDTKAVTVAPAVPAVTVDKGALTTQPGLVVTDGGAVLDAKKSLTKAKDKFQACVDAKGVTASEVGDVELRFLVQSRGRAEGVSVQKRHGVSAATAKCIADVVDRRYVGYPDQPEVGATLVVTISKKK
jgi:hypothetical protein